MATAVMQKERSTHTTEHSSRVVIYEDVPRSGQRLREELSKWQVPASVCQNMEELQGIAPTVETAMFAIDIDMGSGRRTEGLEAIRYLKRTAQGKEHRFYIAALTSHVEHRFEASQAGVDAFVVKTSTETDALELVTRLHAHNIELEMQGAVAPQSLLAKREYEELERQLKASKRWPRRGLASPIDTVQRALNWPFLLPNEQLILSIVHEQLLASQQKHKVDKTIINLCLEGVAMLLDDRARHVQVEQWLHRAREASPDFMLNWLEEETFDDD